MAFNWFNKKKKEDSKDNYAPDFSDIDCQEKAIDLYDQKTLVKLYLMPLEFGGEDGPVNMVYTLEHVLAFKQSFDTIIENLLIEGKDLKYNVNLKYKGNSFIPSIITITVSGDVDFKETIHVW